MILQNQRGLRAGGVATSEGRERGDNDGGIGVAARVDDGGRGATRAAKLYFWMCPEVGILEHVLRATATACSLHGDLKVALESDAGLMMCNGGVEMVIARAEGAKQRSNEVTR